MVQWHPLPFVRDSLWLNKHIKPESFEYMRNFPPEISINANPWHEPHNTVIYVTSTSWSVYFLGRAGDTITNEMKCRKSCEMLFRWVSTDPSSSCLCLEITTWCPPAVCISAPFEMQWKRNKLDKIIWMKLSRKVGSELLCRHQWRWLEEGAASLFLLSWRERRRGQRDTLTCGHPGGDRRGKARRKTTAKCFGLQQLPGSQVSWQQQHIPHHCPCPESHGASNGPRRGMEGWKSNVSPMLS